MTTYTKHTLSGSTDGKGILVSGSASPGIIIHTADSTDLDEVWVYGVNSSITDVKLTLEWGETTSPDGNIEGTIGGEEGLTLIIPGLILTNSNVVRAFSSASGVIIVHGFVNRISA